MDRLALGEEKRHAANANDLLAAADEVHLDPPLDGRAAQVFTRDVDGHVTGRVAQFVEACIRHGLNDIVIARQRIAQGFRATADYSIEFRQC